MSRPAVFLDRDGTMIEDVGYLSSIADLEIYPWTFEAVRLLNRANLPVVVVTNQSGVARGFYSEATLETIHLALAAQLADHGARVNAIYYCPHHPIAGNDSYRRECSCRKPNPGMLHTAAREHGIDLSRSFVVGDKASDVNLAANVGATGVLVLTGYGTETKENRDRWACDPAIIADDLLAAVKIIIGAIERRMR